jgi:hypothetical protein
MPGRFKVCQRAYTPRGGKTQSLFETRAITQVTAQVDEASTAVLFQEKMHHGHRLGVKHLRHPTRGMAQRHLLQLRQRQEDPLGHTLAHSKTARRPYRDAGAMARNSVDELTPALRDAGFRPGKAGEVTSWMRYVTATKAASE